MSILFYTGNGESQNVCADDINLDQCTNSAGHGYVEILAADNNRFINEFVVVYAKMIDKVKYLLSQIRKSLQDNLMLGGKNNVQGPLLLKLLWWEYFCHEA